MSLCTLRAQIDWVLLLTVDLFPKKVVFPAEGTVFPVLIVVNPAAIGSYEVSESRVS